MSEAITNDRLYEAINSQGDKLTARVDSVRLELKGDIRDLRSQFDQLEAGRLTRLEHDFASFRVDLANTKNAERNLDKKFLTGQALFMVILAAASSAFFLWVFGGTGK